MYKVVEIFCSCNDVFHSAFDIIIALRFMQALLEEMVLGKPHFLGTWLCMPLMAFLIAAKYCMWSKKWQAMIHQPCNVLLTLILKDPSFWKKRLVSLHIRLNTYLFIYFKFLMDVVLMLLMNYYNLKRELELEEGTEKSNGEIDKDAIGRRLQEVYKRLEFIDADSAESRAASILAVSSPFVVLPVK